MLQAHKRQITKAANLIEHAIHHGRQIILAHFIKAVIVKRCFIIFDANVVVLSAVNTTSPIGNPHIEPAMKEPDCHGVGANVHKPLRILKQPMLKQHRRPRLFEFLRHSQPEQFQLVIIFCRYEVAVDNDFVVDALHHLPKHSILLLQIHIRRQRILRSFITVSARSQASSFRHYNFNNLFKLLIFYD